MRNFIKYQNRKLYDKTNKAYTNLTKIRSLVANGEQVVITDKKTGQDVTTEVLFNSLNATDFTNQQLINLIKGAKNEENINAN